MLQDKQVIGLVPDIVWSNFSSSRSQICTVPSLAPLASIRQSELKAKLDIPSPCEEDSLAQISYREGAMRVWCTRFVLLRIAQSHGANQNAYQWYFLASTGPYIVSPRSLTGSDATSAALSDSRFRSCTWAFFDSPVHKE